MILSSKATLRWQRAATAGLALAAAALIGACGGGTSQFEPFVAERVFVFGDESSLLRSDGKRYGVNGLDTTVTPGVFNCNHNPLWVQSVAAYYGYAFAECNTALAPAQPKAFMRAAAGPVGIGNGTKVADVAAQVEAQAAAGGLHDKDLVLVLAGANDVLEIYVRFKNDPSLSEASLLAEARARGEQMAGVVNRLVGLGAKVVVANLADLGMSPYARAEALANAGVDIDRAALITRLTNAFNERLGVKVLLDGRFVGLVQMDLRTQSAARSPGSFGLTDVSTAVCTVALPDCDDSTVPAGASSATFLWADATRLGPGGQSQLAILALQRVQRNPF